MIQAYAVHSAGGDLTPFEYDPGPLGNHEVEVRVEYCGICHSDLSMLENEWGMTRYPLVPGHEVVGVVADTGADVNHLETGQRVGIGWHSGACMNCGQCVAGDHNLCASAQGTIVGRHGGFAERVRAHATFVVPLPAGVDPSGAGPLFCGGITVFNPVLQFGLRPTARVGVVGIGGLGHLAIQFLDKWGCEVTAFSSRPEKEPEAREMGADHFVVSRDKQAIEALAGSFDFIIVTVNVGLDWDLYVQALAPRGRLHFVGAVLEPLGVQVFPLLSGQRSISGSPVGSPGAIRKMLDFAARHGVRPVTETFPMSQVNEAVERLRSGNARYRIVLEQDAGK